MNCSFRSNRTPQVMCCILQQQGLDKIGVGKPCLRNIFLQMTSDALEILSLFSLYYTCHLKTPVTDFGVFLLVVFLCQGNCLITRRCLSQRLCTSAISHWTVRCGFQLVHKKTGAVFHSDGPGPRALDSDVKNIGTHFTSDDTLIC